MLRTDSHPRPDTKRRTNNHISHKRKQFADAASAAYKQQEYPYRLNFYDVPPTAEITLEQFEGWGIDRLRVLAELESTSFRNLTPPEVSAHMQPLLNKYLPLSSNSASPQGASDPLLRSQRQKDHYSHFILRLAFSATDELRRRFARVESVLFRLRWQSDDARERAGFVGGLEFDWETVSESEKRELGQQMREGAGGWAKVREGDAGAGEEWFKVDWERVPELVEGRRVFIRKGKAYVPGREQLSFVLAEFGSRLEKALELTSRALPRLDEDDRLTPILTHLSHSFTTPLSHLSDADSSLPGAPINAATIDSLASQHFPLCMSHLHRTLRANSHLRHFGRLQYTLFLKGLGLSLDECLLFWRRSFAAKTDESTFNKEYRYNVRHAYGDVGGDSNRRGKGYSPFSCQRILTEHPPGTGEAHGCPYKHFSPDNLTALLQSSGVDDSGVLRGVREDVGSKRFHIACNRVFEWSHRNELKRVREDGSWTSAELDTIVHPNTYFKRSYLLKNGKDRGEGGGGMEE